MAKVNNNAIHMADSLASAYIPKLEFTWLIESKKVIINYCIKCRYSKELDQIALKIQRSAAGRTEEP